MIGGSEVCVGASHRSRSGHLDDARDAGVTHVMCEAGSIDKGGSAAQFLSAAARRVSGVALTSTRGHREDPAIPRQALFAARVDRASRWSITANTWRCRIPWSQFDNPHTEMPMTSGNAQAACSGRSVIRRNGPCSRNKATQAVFSIRNMTSAVFVRCGRIQRLLPGEAAGAFNEHAGNAIGAAIHRIAAPIERHEI